MSQELKNLIELNIPDNDTRFIKPSNLRTVLNATVDEYDGISYTFGDIGGTVGNSQLSGTYTNASFRFNGSQTISNTTSPGSTNNVGLTVDNLAMYRSALSSTVGCIVFNSEVVSGSGVMFQFEIDIYTYGGVINVPTKLIIEGYLLSGAFYNLGKLNLGGEIVTARLGVRTNGRLSIILGDINTVWSYPLVRISKASFSNNITLDKGWTTQVLTSLDDFSLVSSYIVNNDPVNSLTNQAPAKTTPVDADVVPLVDSQATNTLKKLSWANIKTALQSFFLPLTGGIISGDRGTDSTVRISLKTTGNSKGLIISGKGKTGNSTEADPHGLLLALSHNDSSGGNRQLFLGNSETEQGIRVIGTTLDGYNFATNSRLNMTIGTDTTHATFLSWPFLPASGEPTANRHPVNKAFFDTQMATKASTDLATTSANGLMSAADKTKLNNVGDMANRNVTVSTSAPSGGTNGDIWLQV